MLADIDIKAAPKTVSRRELLHEGSDERFRSLVHDLLAFSSRLQDIRGRFGAHIGLTGIQYTILISIRRLGGTQGVGVTELARHLSLSSPFVTVETRKLLDLDLIGRRAHPSDKRRVRLTVSDAGEARLARLLPLQQQVNDALFASLDHEGFERLVGMAEDLKKDADKALRLADFLSGEAQDD